MQYILSAIFAALLVLGQTSLKLALDKPQNPFHGTLTVAAIARFLVSPLVLLGFMVYGLAMLLYLYLLSKYQFSAIQSLAIPASLLFSIAVAVAFFGEHLISVNYLGLGFIVTGIVLVSLR